jgi:SAM-dependent methyltransferase
MPSASWNLRTWDADYDWSQAGEEWSAPWGGSEAQWHGTLLPRIHRFFPAARILEIAPGYGRWTRFLIPSCATYLGIDLSPTCIDVCRQQFKSATHARFETNDGTSLADAEDGSFDFVFSFDSLVHAEIEILEAYVPQILRKLSRKGVAFIHHSNRAIGKVLEGEHSHDRAETVSAEKVARIICDNGGIPLVQERISWMNAGLIDCISLFGRSADFPAVETVHIHNLEIMREASLIRKYQAAYTGSTFGADNG